MRRVKLNYKKKKKNNKSLFELPLCFLNLFDEYSYILLPFYYGSLARTLKYNEKHFYYYF